MPWRNETDRLRRAPVLKRSKVRSRRAAAQPVSRLLTHADQLVCLLQRDGRYRCQLEGRNA